MRRVLVLVGACALAHGVVAKDAPMRFMNGDARVQKVVYDPYRVVSLTGAFGYTLAVEFAEDERIKQLSAGDTVAWQIVPKANRLFLKPQEETPETNLVVYTDKRAYQFSLRGVRAKGLHDPRITYRVQFQYPDEDMRRLARLGEEDARAGLVPRSGHGAPTPKPPTQWNFKYSFKGSGKAAPLQALDDGEFTYFRFAAHDNTPAIFLVDSDKKETLVNYRREGEWLVVERVARQYTLRANNNADVACVFNDGFPQRPATGLANRDQDDAKSSLAPAF